MIHCKTIFGIVIALVVYVAIGGLIYHLLERDQLLTCNITASVLKIWNEFEGLNTSNDLHDIDMFNSTSPLIEELSEFDVALKSANLSSNLTREDRLIASLQAVIQSCHKLTQGNQCGTRMLDFNDAFYLAMTVVTTIGYGDLVPRSMGGKLFTIFFGFFGIPLCFFTMATLGDKMKRAIDEGIKKIPFLERKRYRRLYRVSKVVFLMVVGQLVFFILPAYILREVETDWQFFDAYYFIFVSTATIGFGDLVTGKNYSRDDAIFHAFRVGFYIWCFLGISYIFLIIQIILDTIRKRTGNLDNALYYNPKDNGTPEVRITRDSENGLPNMLLRAHMPSMRSRLLQRVIHSFHACPLMDDEDDCIFQDQMMNKKEKSIEKHEEENTTPPSRKRDPASEGLLETATV